MTSESTRRERARPAALRPIARHGKLRRSRAWTTVLALAGASLAIVLVSATIVAGVAVWNVANAIKPGVTLIGETEGPPPNIGAYEGGINLLIVGSDSGEGDAQFGNRDGAMLNDVNILVHVAQDHSSATVVSFPRDMFVPVPACPNENGGTYRAISSAKINTTLIRGGLACVVATVEAFTGISIEFAAKVEMGGVIQMSNAVGGVEVCVAKAIRDRQIGLYLDAGTHTLEGWEAQLFLRSRYGVTGGTDVARINNQYVFLSSLVRKVKSDEVLGNPLAVYQLALAAADNMQLSNSLRNINTLMAIGLTVKDIPLENIVFAQYPTTFGGGGLVANRSIGNVLIDAIKADLPVMVAGTGAGAVLDENQPVPTPSPSASPEPSGSPSADPVESSAPPVEAVALPHQITGQSAAQSTCSTGQTAGG
ncbi:MAG: LCP family protein [Cryobacterium sp.]|nr:LCP family protein [Cryobacterium sp.]